MGFIVLYFQWVFQGSISILGAVPSFIVIYIVFTGLKYGSIQAIWLGLLFGFIWDALTATSFIGLTAFSLIITGYFAGIFEKRIARITIFYRFGLYLTFISVFEFLSIFIYFQNSTWDFGAVFFLIVIPNTLYTYIVTLIAFHFLAVGDK